MAQEIVGTTSVCPGVGTYSYYLSVPATGHSWSASGGSVEGSSTGSSVAIRWHSNTTTGTVYLSYTPSSGGGGNDPIGGGGDLPEQEDHENGPAPFDVNSLSLRVTIRSITNVAGVISGSAAYCSMGSGSITLSGNSKPVIKWQKKEGQLISDSPGDFGWTDLSVTSNTLPYRNLTTSTMYRAVVDAETCENGYSDIALVTVYPETVAGSIMEPSDIECGFDSGRINLQNATGQVVQWESSTNWADWQIIESGLPYYDYVFSGVEVRTTMRYRALVRSGTCAAKYTNTVMFDVFPASKAGTISANKAGVCTAPVEDTKITLTLNDYVGDIFTWERRDLTIQELPDPGEEPEPVTWYPVRASGSVVSNYPVSKSSIFRVKVQKAGCPEAISDEFYVWVHPAPAGKLVGNRNDLIANNNTGQVQLLEEFGVTSRRWETSTNGGVSWNHVPAFDDQIVFNYSNIDYETKVRVVLDNIGCSPVTTSPVTLKVEHALNWTSQTAYDENGTIVGASKQYFDWAGQGLQSQSKNLTESLVMASQPIKDKYGRSAISSLSAPINRTEFEYHGLFVTNSNNSEPYSYKHFDIDQYGYNPQPMGNNVKGTLGWYYSANNNLEDNVPVTAYPYSRVEYYKDGTGGVKKSAGPGEYHRLGSGFNTETSSVTVKEANEVDNYLEIMNTYVFPGTNVIEDAIVSVGKDPNGNYGLSVSDGSENILMTARKGDTPLPQTRTNVLEDETHSNFIYFYILEDNTSINISGSTSYYVENLLSGASLGNPGSLGAGFYRIVVTADPLQTVTLSYDQGYGDISYNYYDKAGRLKVSISPNGVRQLSEGISYEHIDKTTYEYNHQGWLLSTTEPDAGTSEYVYRKDGSIRYSQNAKQKLNDDFSYTLYDKLGRPIESGEAFAATDNSLKRFKSTGMYATLNLTGFYSLYDNNGALERRDWVKTHYDIADPEFSGETGLSLVQDYINGAVSWTENENIKTWYSYDESGRVTWMAQKPAQLDRTFVAQYDYDFLGNVLQVSYFSYDAGGVKLDEFHHYYTYDPDRRLSKVYTSLNGSLSPEDFADQAELQAKYDYYLHGPLKRIELGGDLQGIDFVYNINGWLKQINHPSLNADKDPGGDGANGFGQDAFGMILNYYESNMNGLFNTASLMPQPDAGAIHGLPGFEVDNTIELATLFPRLKPGGLTDIDQGLGEYSGDNPEYKNMIRQYIDQEEANRGRE